MCGYSFDPDNRLSRIKGLINNLTLFTAVDSICEFHRKQAEIHCFGPSEACFFIGYEGDVNLSVLYGRILLKDFKGNDHIGHGSLIVSPEH